MTMAKEEPRGCPVMTAKGDWRLGHDSEVKDVVNLVLYGRIFEMATLPGGVDHRGGHGGKVLGLEVAW
jgi:hypothetical protein